MRTVHALADWPCRAIVVLCLGGLVLGAAAQEPGNAAFERQRIAQQRAQAEADYARAERECQQRFAVTACVDEARRGQRAALASLRRQTAVLDESERRQRAAARTQAIRERISAEEARQRETGAAPRAPSVLAAPKSNPRSVSASSPSPAVSASAAQRAAEESRSRALFEARQAQAQAHREAAELRAAQRGQRATPSAPLPSPPPSSAPKKN